MAGCQARGKWSRYRYSPWFTKACNRVHQTVAFSSTAVVCHCPRNYWSFWQRKCLDSAPPFLDYQKLLCGSRVGHITAVWVHLKKRYRWCRGWSKHSPCSRLWVDLISGIWGQRFAYRSVINKLSCVDCVKAYQALIHREPWLEACGVCFTSLPGQRTPNVKSNRDTWFRTIGHSNWRPSFEHYVLPPNDILEHECVSWVSRQNHCIWAEMKRIVLKAISAFLGGPWG